MSEYNNYYETLGVSRTAPLEVIRAAYKVLSQKWHPDRNNSDEALSRMQAINGAWETLSDSETRSAYDAQLTEIDRLMYDFLHPTVQASTTGSSFKDSERDGAFWVNEDVLKKYGMNVMAPGYKPPSRKLLTFMQMLVALVVVGALWVGFSVLVENFIG